MAAGCLITLARPLHAQMRKGKENVLLASTLPQRKRFEGGTSLGGHLKAGDTETVPRVEEYPVLYKNVPNLDFS